MKRTLSLLLLAGGLAEAGYAQAPATVNARVETRHAQGDSLRILHEFIAGAAGPEWFGYAVPALAHEGDENCWNGCCSEYRLEGDHQSSAVTAPGPVKLEGPPEVFILYRVENRTVNRIRPLSGRCPLDAGGLRFTWFTDVNPDASVALLSEQVLLATGKHEPDAALVAIAEHAAPAADSALERFAGRTHPEWLREKALFWLASNRGAAGSRVVVNAARTDPSDAIREKTMFDLTLSKQPEAVDQLIQSAQHDASTRVRGQALFWLAQKAGKKAAGAIQNAIENDPDTEVKKKAVFALQNLPKDEGVPLLIEVARGNRNPEVRKQAFFWLGQSGDPRALAFIQQILER